MVSLSSQILLGWIASFILPLTRILGVIALAPPFGNAAMPMSIKIMLGVAIASLIAPLLPPLSIDIFTLHGIILLAQEFVNGMAIGFVIRLAFSAVEMAGETIGLTMGLGFATFFDPQTQGRSSAIAQFLVLLATLIFLSLDLHLVLLSALIDSFNDLPPTQTIGHGLHAWSLTNWGGHIFSDGLRIALPLIGALLITNLALGILTRAAPQLNLFGIGFPITIGVGFLMLGLVLPHLLAPLQALFQSAFSAISVVLVSPAP